MPFMTSEEAKLTIKSIELINFMCHRHLFIEFTKMLTCIGGRNGSGKSAVMIALGIVLGQRANALDRGNTYKELIKSGEHTAVIKLCINNHFHFQEDFFGDRILIEKTLHLNFSKLRILNSGNKVWSKKKQDMEDIVDFYSLHLDNPLNFLTQDMSKKFLNLSKPQALYSFFLKGTEIESMEVLHAEAYDQVERMRTKIDKIEDDLDVLEKDFSEKNKRLGYLTELTNFKEDLKDLEEERKWSELMEMKDDIEETGDDIRDMEKTKKAKKKELYGLEEGIAALEEEISMLKEEHVAEKNRNESTRRALETSISQLELKEREINNDMKSVDEQLCEKSVALEEYNKADSKKDVEGGLKKNLKALEVNLESLKGEKDEGLRTEKELRELVGAESADVEELNNKKLVLKKQIAFLSNVKKNILTFFSDRMPEVLSEIKRENLSVIGPLGSLIRLKEAKWYKPVSIILRNNLSNFIVRSKSEREKLSTIFKKYDVKFKTLLPSNQKGLIQYKSNKIFKTVLDVLDIKHELVTNQLVILQNIEQIILVENREEAHKVIRRKPSYVLMAYTTSGDRISLVGNSLSDFRQRYTGRFYFENDDSKLNACTEELKRFSLINPKSSKQELRDAEGKNYKISREINKLERDIKIAEFELESHSKVTHVASTSNMQNEIKILRNQKVGLDRALLENKNKISEIRNQLKEIKGTAINLTSKEEKIRNFRTKKYALEASIEALRPKIHEKDKERNGKAEIFERKREELLEEGCKENEDTRPLGVIEKEINAINFKISASKDMESEKDLRNSVENTKKQRDFKNGLILKYKKRVEDFVEFVKKRVKKRENMKIEIAESANEEFNKLTQYRGYEGVLAFDHEQKALDVKMGIENMEAGSKGTLSGGERSFASICFLLSLWPNVGCPVKVLDEFDVFMDNLNRKFTIKIILGFLKKNEYQVILITPLNTKDLFTDICDVVVLEKPRED